MVTTFIWMVHNRHWSSVLDDWRINSLVLQSELFYVSPVERQILKLLYMLAQRTVKHSLSTEFPSRRPPQIAFFFCRIVNLLNRVAIFCSLHRAHLRVSQVRRRNLSRLLRDSPPLKDWIKLKMRTDLKVNVKNISLGRFGRDSVSLECLVFNVASGPPSWMQLLQAFTFFVNCFIRSKFDFVAEWVPKLSKILREPWCSFRYRVPRFFLACKLFLEFFIPSFFPIFNLWLFFNRFSFVYIVPATS